MVIKRGPYKKESVVARLQRHTRIDGDCWLWTGAIHPFGYGRIGIADEILLVHRVAYVEFVGPIPDGMNVLHRCDRAACWNPLHLFLGTHADNAADKVAKGRQYRGERHHCFTLTDEDLRLAASMHAAGASWRSLSRRFHVSHDMVRQDCMRRLPSQ